MIESLHVKNGMVKTIPFLTLISLIFLLPELSLDFFPFVMFDSKILLHPRHGNHAILFLMAALLPATLPLKKILYHFFQLQQEF